VCPGFWVEAQERRFLIRFLTSVPLCGSWRSVSEAEMVFEIRNLRQNRRASRTTFHGFQILAPDREVEEVVEKETRDWMRCGFSW